MNMRTCLLLSAALTASTLCTAGILPEKIACEGNYGGHLQGIATDGESIYWSFTVKVIKTDLAGKILLSREAPSHQGDLCYKDGTLYVAVNRGRFNTETNAISEVTSYDARTLEPIKTIPLPEVRHGAGGMTWKDDRFYVVGGLPLMHEHNYVYEYTSSFQFVRRHDLDTGYTWMGIQTAAYEDGRFLFGIYGASGDTGGVLSCPADLSTFVRYIGRGSTGIMKLDGAYYVGGSKKDKESGRFTGWIVRDEKFQSSNRLYCAKPRGRGELRLFFDGRDTSGWKDSGHLFDNNGNKPIFSQNQLFVPAKAASACTEFPAVGIGGERKFWTPDLVRGVRRAAEGNETFSLHMPGTPATLKNDPELAAAVDATVREAKRLGVKVVGEWYDATR